MSEPKVLKIDEVEYVRKDSLKKEVIVKDPKYEYFPIGKQVAIRTVTMIDVGTLVNVTDTDFVLSKVSWIADTGRWSDFIHNKISPNDVEPFDQNKLVFINRGSYVDTKIIKNETEYIISRLIFIGVKKD